MSMPWEDYKAKDPNGPWNDFNTSTAQPEQTPEPSKSSPGSPITEALKSVLPSEESTKPLEPSVPTDVPSALKSGLGMVGQALSNPMRLGPTLSAPGQAIGQEVENKTGSKVAGFVTSALADPQTYLGLEAGSLPKGIQKQLASLGEVLSGVDKQSFLELANNPLKVMRSASSSETGKIFQAAKEAAGVTAEEERQLATKEGFRRKIYNSVMSKIDDMKPLETGEVVNVDAVKGHMGKEVLPAQKLTYNGPLMADSVESLRAKGMSEEAIKEVTQPTYNISADIPGHPANSTLSETTLKQVGYDLSSRGASAEKPTVSELLRAKRAGQLMAESDPSAAGFIQKEIHDKINPMIKEIAPDVFKAQQAVHFSKVKEAFEQLFPGGKGMYKYFRTLGMLGGSLFHGMGALESPVVAGTATLAGSTASKIGLSPAALFTVSKAFNPALNTPQLQSLRDRLRNKFNAE